MIFLVADENKRREATGSGFISEQHLPLLVQFLTLLQQSLQSSESGIAIDDVVDFVIDNFVIVGGVSGDHHVGPW